MASRPYQYSAAEVQIILYCVVTLQVNAVNIGVIMGVFPPAFINFWSHRHRLIAVDVLQLYEHVRGKQLAYVSGSESHLFSILMVFCNWCVFLCGVA